MVGLSPLGKLWREKLENLKTWRITYTAELVSKHHLNKAMLHEIIAKALQDQAGAVGYLIGDDAADLTGDNDDSK
jgi:hypothetical protein